MEASREGHEEMVALLLSQGADINAQTEETQETALTLACCGGFLEVADFLIKVSSRVLFLSFSLQLNFLFLSLFVCAGLRIRIRIRLNCWIRFLV